MKFLCDSCKAKYQIPDEKVAGRTLRMKCRKCGHDILIRGEGAATASTVAPVPTAPKPRAPAPAPAAKPSSHRPPAAPPAAASSGGMRRPIATSAKVPAPPAPAPRPAAAAASSGSALGADFRRSLAGSPAPSPQRRSSAPPPPPAELWHVAINDVPVGPISREDVAKRVADGSVSGQSLVWREGFDDWRPLADAPELARLVGYTSSMPPTPGGVPGRGSRPMVAPVGGRQGAAAMGVDPSLADSFDDEATFVSEGLQPEASSSAGFRPGTGALRPAAAAHAPAAQPMHAHPVARISEPPPPARSAMTPGAWMGVAAAGAFGVVLAFIVGQRLLSDDGEAAAAVAAPASPTTATAAPEPEAAPEATGTPEPTAEAVAEAPTHHSGTHHGTKATRPASTTGSTGLSAEDQALLAQFGQGGGAAPSKLRVAELDGAGSNRGPLDEAEVRRVVTRNKPALQRCYDRAIRGRGDAPSVRMDIEIQVGSSGTVTRATSSGEDFGGLAACLESSVRRWRFPGSSEGGTTRFPVVFSGGG